MYCFVSLTDSALLIMVGFASFPLLVHHYWACFVFFYFTHCFIIFGHDLYCSSSNLIGSCLLGIVCIVLHPSLVHHYQACFALFYFLHWLIIIGNDLYCFISIFTGSSLLYMFFFFFISRLTASSLLGMARFVSLTSLAYLHWAWPILFHFMLLPFINTGYGLHCFTSCFTCSSLLCMACNV